MESCIKKRHFEILYPTVRVVSQKAGGSGTVLFSNVDSEGKVRTFVLTNHHVIADSIEVKKQWDSLLGKEIKKESKKTVKVELFKYNNFSHCIGSNAVEADIVAYDSDQDLALLELRDKENRYPYVAKLYPRDKIDDIHIFDETFACGAAMGHAPITTSGYLVFMDDEIDNYKYWMSTAQTIFGNSGGAIYRYDKKRKQYEFIGIPARITVVLAGFSATPITHMGYFVPIDRIYRFFDKYFYQFIYNSEYTIEKCEKLRKKEKRKAREALERQFGVVEEEEEK